MPIKHKLIEGFFKLPTGALIEDVDRYIHLGRLVMRKRLLKYIIDQRKTKDLMNVDEIKIMFLRIEEVFKNPDICIPNPNRKHVGRLLIGKLYPHEERGLLVIISDNEIFNSYYRALKKFGKIKND